MPHRMTLADCVRLAEFAHFHQQDKAGFDYIEHPKRVLAAVQAQGVPPYAQMAAILHDVTEDTAFTPEMLLELGVPEAAVNIVRLLDRNVSKEKYENDVSVWQAYAPAVDEPTWWDRLTGTYISEPPNQTEYYYRMILTNPEAVKVKLADITDNTLHWRVVYLPLETQERLRKKYTYAREYLTGVLKPE